MQVTKEVLTRLRIVMSAEDITAALLEYIERKQGGGGRWDSSRELTMKVTASGKPKSAEISGFYVQRPIAATEPPRSTEPAQSGVLPVG